MAIKAGQILHVGNDSVVIDRIQTAGPGNLNIPTEKIYELGNYKSVATIRDVPDLSFTMESLDVSTEIEALLLDNPTYVASEGYDLSLAKPLEMASQFKAGRSATDAFATVASVGIPFLVVESVGYRFGLRDNARQTVTLRGDSIFYNPGSTFVDTVVGSGVAGQTLVTTHPAYITDDGGTRRVLSVTVGDSRLFKDVDYTETYGAVAAGAATTTLTFTKAIPATKKIRAMYASPDVRTYPQSVHPDALTKPAAVRGKDIDIYLGGYDPADVAGSAVNRLASVQGISADYRVTLEKDEEFGNYYAVANDFEVPAVTGSIDLKPASVQELFALVRKLSGVTDPLKVVGPSEADPLELDIVIKNGLDGSTLKRLHVPDARFTTPGFSGRANTRFTNTINFESDEGTLKVFKA
jgi:hypothetical protein